MSDDVTRAEPTVEELLDFEAVAPSHPSQKARAIRHELGIDPLYYDRLIERAIQNPRAREYRGDVVSRLEAERAYGFPRRETRGGDS